MHGYKRRSIGKCIIHAALMFEKLYATVRCRCLTLHLLLQEGDKTSLEIEHGLQALKRNSELKEATEAFICRYMSSIVPNAQTHHAFFKRPRGFPPFCTGQLEHHTLRQSACHAGLDQLVVFVKPEFKLCCRSSTEACRWRKQRKSV